MTKWLSIFLLTSTTVIAQDALEFMPETDAVEEVTQAEDSPWKAIEGLEFLDDVEANLGLRQNQDGEPGIMPDTLPTFDILEEKPFFAKFRVLNSKNDLMTSYTLNKDGGVYHDNILITVRNCVPDFKEQADNDIAFFEVQDTKDTSRTFFKGWIFSKVPSASSLEHSVYDIFFDSCTYTEIKTN